MRGNLGLPGFPQGRVASDSGRHVLGFRTQPPRLLHQPIL